MPLYNYRCIWCGHTKEIIVARRSDTFDEMPCPVCNHKTGLRLQPSAASFQLRGAGFHAVDYKGKK